MHVAIAIAVGLVATLALVLVAGMTPFMGIPIIVLLVVLALLGGAVFARNASRKLETEGVPTTREAAYEPVVDPAERS
jgi:hypothetical protein